MGKLNFNNLTSQNEPEKIVNQNFTTLTFFEFLEKLNVSPLHYSRSAVRYLSDCFDYFGCYEVQSFGEKIKRWKVFDSVSDSKKRFKIIGHEEEQNYIVNKIKSFASQDKVDKMILLKGPTGTAKSTHLMCITSALEEYSKTEEGSLYTISWEIPFNFGEKAESKVGFLQEPQDESHQKLNKKNIIKKTCDFNDKPIFAIPKHLRKELLQKLEKKYNLELTSEFISDGELCVNCTKIYNRLLRFYGGNHEKVWEHLLVERLELSLFGNVGVIKIDPQKNPDFSVREEKVWGYRELPPILQDITFYSPASGGIHRGNHGLIEYSDIFKRSPEYLKCLLDVIQDGILSDGSLRVQLDTTFFATTNEEDFFAFTRDALYVPFRRRFDAIDLGYSLKISDEMKIHAELFKTVAKEFDFCPFSEEALSLWAVTTRLEEPNPNYIDYKRDDVEVLSKITPLLKALVYDEKEIPQKTIELGRRLGEISYEESIKLKKNLVQLRNEWRYLREDEKSVKYEGLIGASPSVVSTILQDLANCSPKCVTYLEILQNIKNFIEKNLTHYGFTLRSSDPKTRFYYFQTVLSSIENYYDQKLVADVLDASGIIVEEDLEGKLKKYINCLKTYLTKEKSYFDTETQTYVELDLEFMKDFETYLEGFDKNIDAERSRIQFKLAEGLQKLRLEAPKSKIDAETYKKILNREVEFYKKSVLKSRLQILDQLVTKTLDFLDDENSGKTDFPLEKEVKIFIERMQKRKYKNKTLRSLLGHLKSKDLLNSI
ncbi:hypothetical protein IT568_03665 [bacterium]|nr:hypothetical protein [bacterium]